MSSASTCPAGYICDPAIRDSQFSCAELQQKPVQWGYGNLHAGLYCPENVDEYQNCPAGYYCETPSEKVACPSGYFCPHKTAQYSDSIRCRACDSGATQLSRAAYGYVIIAFLILGALGYVGYRIFKSKREEDVEHFRRLVKRRVDNVWLEKAVRQQQKDLEAIRPQLELLARRLGSRTVLSNGSSSGGSSSLEFDARELFDHIDTNGDGELTYHELNSQLLHLQTVELRDFVRRMNERAHKPHDQKTVSRSVFCRHFVAVLLKQRNLRPTPQEAAALFDEMAQESLQLRRSSSSSGGIEIIRRGSSSNNKSIAAVAELGSQAFYRNEHLSSFLTEQQIFDLFSILQGISASIMDPPGASSSSRIGQTILSVGGAASTRHRHHPQGVTRKVFIDNYPETLAEILGSDADPASITCAAPQGGGVDIAFENLSLSVQVAGEDVKAVDSVTGRLRAGTMVSLMGGSGAGKSSLLNALCGRAFYGKVTGDIRINGHKSSIEDHSGSTGFVPQDDIVYPELTVRENLVYSGRFRLPRGTKLEKIYKLADETLANLGLSRVANSRVGDVHRRGVSGGEKKRVNIGLELMARPRALFLDEPTSGMYATILVVVVVVVLAVVLMLVLYFLLTGR